MWIMAERSRGYREVARDIAGRIAAGEYAPGATLPSAEVIRRTYNVSMTTADRVLTALRGAGLIDTQHGMLPRVRIQPERRQKWVRPGSRLITRPPTLEERDQGVPDGVSMIELYYRDEFELLRGDEVMLVFE